MEVRIADCPLGAKCEDVIEENGRQVLLRCPWFVKIQGKDPQSEEQLDEWRCGIAWQPLLAVENAQQVRGVHHAVEKMRNEVVEGQNNFLNLIQANRNRQLGRG